MDTPLVIDVWGLISGVVFPVLVVIVGGFCILLYGGQSTLRNTNGDQEKRIALLEAERQRDKAALSSKDGEIDALRRVVTGEVQLTAIADVLNHHHEQAVVVWERIDETLVGVDETLAGILGRLKGPR